MNSQDSVNFYRIAKAIEYIQKHFPKQPSLEEIANEVHLSPFHFQKLFKNWAGVSPKKFLQYTSIQHAKQLLNKTPTLSLFETSDQIGLSSTGRLHDLFVTIEGMTPGEFKKQGAGLSINYSYHETLFGNLLVASTHKGICYMGFSDNETEAFKDLSKRFSKANFINTTDELQQKALLIFSKDWDKIDEIKLHLKGTDFQLKVWEALLKIPTGDVTTYGAIAQQIEKPKASRAVGTAIGSNPIAFLIPCHRVIQSTGITGGYMWGATRKKVILGWEASILCR